ncbi:ABC transporter ATP-binding protein [Defluviitalea phaphyphila]|uniref:ABC transporter ATP-binding protein n=1 Tax=Defluviitalea phaphyphila TaxID=1473580 RepID=UPI0007307A21|nr:ABC transporter ATP-binding protein [Defluviitalea phaphyphila]
MIELKNLTVSYGNKIILNNISTTFQEGDFVCIIGKNGCGKSTLLKTIIGLKNYSGKILLNNIDIKNLSRIERAKEIAYLPQIREVPSIDVKTLIEHGRFPYLGFSKILKQEDKDKISYAIEITSTKDILNKKVIELSGGERQRVYLAMVIAQDAKTIILDEPTTFLDISHQIEMMEIISKLNKEGKNIIIVVHDLPQAFTYGNEIKVIDRGNVVIEGKPDNLYKNVEIGKIFGISLTKTHSKKALYSYHLVKKNFI